MGMGPSAEPDPEGSGDGAVERRAKIFAWPFGPGAILPQVPRARAWLIGIAFGVGYFALRTSPPMLHGYEADFAAYTRWYEQIAASGLRTVYDRSDFDYPPLYAYLLWTLTKGQQLLGEIAGRTLIPSFPLLLRIWPLIFDLGIAWLLMHVGRTAARAGAAWAPASAAARAPAPASASASAGAATATAGGAMAARWEWILPVLYLLNPVVLFDTGYWGQTDSIHSGFVLAAFLALGWRARGNVPGGEAGPPAWVGWVLMALGSLMKPVALPYFPMILALSICWHGVRSTIWGMAAAAITIAGACLPFMVGDPLLFTETLVMDLSSMPFTSCNAHNLWWILGAWRPSGEPWLGSLSARDVGYILFGIFLTVVLVRTWSVALRREVSLAEGCGLAAAVGTGFFMLSTHLHENHLFAVLPLLLPLAVLPWANGPARTRAALWLVAGATLGVLLNMVAHDPWLVIRGPWAEAAQHRIDPVLSVPTGGRRRLLAALGTGVNFLFWALLMRHVFTGSPMAPRRPPRGVGRRSERSTPALPLSPPPSATSRSWP
jgi:hypothetical protein